MEAAHHTVEPLASIKRELLAALSHREAEDGLFFCNFQLLHEEDERPSVHGSPKALATALTELVREGQVYLWEENDRIVFKLAGSSDHRASDQGRSSGQGRGSEKSH